VNYSETKYRLAIVLVVVAILASLGVSSPSIADLGPSIPRVGDLAPPPPAIRPSADVPPVVQQPKAKPPSSLDGKATWYGKILQGRETASGEPFDMFRFTAAHKKLPFGTVLRVTNRQNGKWVVVRITDRGPLAPGRVLDLSYAAARQIGMVEAGVVSVHIERLDSKTLRPVQTLTSGPKGPHLLASLRHD
jgi:rare lipoprotein A (peptidoglycan hydrolase)